MKKNLIILYIAGAILLGGLFAFFSGGGKNGIKPSEYSQGALVAAETEFDFGTIPMEGGDVSHRFQLKNEGEEPVLIEKVYTSCMCTIAEVFDKDGKNRGEFGMPGHGPQRTDISVGSKEPVFIDAVFDPAAHGPSGVGLAERVIYIETNSQKSPKVELSFTATVTR